VDSWHPNRAHSFHSLGPFFRRWIDNNKFHCTDLFGDIERWWVVGERVVESDYDGAAGTVDRVSILGGC
jgi:hypothetical protein